MHSSRALKLLLPLSSPPTTPPAGTICLNCDNNLQNNKCDITVSNERTWMRIVSPSSVPYLTISTNMCTISTGPAVADASFSFSFSAPFGAAAGVKK